LFTGYYPPPFNANAVRAMYIVKAFRELGHEVTVVPLIGTSNSRGFYGELIATIREVKEQDSEEKFYKRPSLISRASDILRKHRRTDKILSIAREFSPDVVIGTLPPIEALPIAHIVAQTVGACLIADVQDLADDYRVLERPWLAPLIKLYFRRVYAVLREAKLVVTTTEFMQKVLISRIGHSRVTTVPNGVDNEFYSIYFETRKRCADELAVFLGDLNFKYHKLEVFIQALKIAKDRGIKLRLRVIGEGVLLPRLKSLAKTLGLENNIEFLGYVKRAELPQKLGCGRFGIVGRPAKDNPWIVNTMRMTTLEYLSCGLPILAYGPANSYTQHFIEKHSIGVYVPSNNPKHVATGIEQLLSLIHSDPNISNRCRNVALKYDWNTILKMFAQLTLRSC